MHAKIMSGLRVLEPAFSPGFLTLVAFGTVRLTLDLLLAASQTRLCESLSWLSGLCHAPIGIDGFPIDDLWLMGSIGVNEAQLAINISLINHVWKQCRRIWAGYTLRRRHFTYRRGLVI
jgi:hypothetical protein